MVKTQIWLAGDSDSMPRSTTNILWVSRSLHELISVPQFFPCKVGAVGLNSTMSSEILWWKGQSVIRETSATHSLFQAKGQLHLSTSGNTLHCSHDP